MEKKVGDSMVTLNKKKVKVYRKCEQCEKEKVTDQFYSADPLLFPSGKLHICKACTLKKLEEADNEHDMLIAILRFLNKPYLQNVYKGDSQDYIRSVNTMIQYKNLTFLDSDTLLEKLSYNSLNTDKPTEMSSEELEIAKAHWGVGVAKTEEDFLWLENERQDYYSRYEINTKSMEDYITDICLTRLDIRKEREAGRDVDKKIATLDKLLSSANLRPVQETGANSVEQETFGTLIRKWENENPIPEPLEEFRDVDGIGKFMRTYLFGHLARALGLENKFQDEYDEEIAKHTVSPSDLDEDDD